jgi:hypothetical protein
MTVDAFTTPVLVYLADRDPALVEADYRRFREAEASGLYEGLLESESLEGR